MEFLNFPLPTKSSLFAGVLSDPHIRLALFKKFARVFFLGSTGNKRPKYLELLHPFCETFADGLARFKESFFRGKNGEF